MIIRGNIARSVAELIVVGAVCTALVVPVETSASAITFDPIDFAAQDLPQDIKEYILDAIAFAINDVLIEAIAQDTISWIRSGFENSPGFVENAGDLLARTAEGAATSFIEGASLKALCDPFEVRVRVELHQSRSFNRRFECTLDGVVNNFDRFVGGTFSDSGWPGWVAVMTQPQNNPYSAWMLANEETKRRSFFQTENEEKELSFGRGFLRVKTCDPQYVDVDTGYCWQHRTQTPGAYVDQSLIENAHIGNQRISIGDEIDEILGALLAQLTTQLLSEAGGLGGRP